MSLWSVAQCKMKKMQQDKRHSKVETQSEVKEDIAS